MGLISPWEMKESPMVLREVRFLHLRLFLGDCVFPSAIAFVSAFECWKLAIAVRAYQPDVVHEIIQGIAG